MSTEFSVNLITHKKNRSWIIILSAGDSFGRSLEIQFVAMPTGYASVAQGTTSYISSPVSRRCRSKSLSLDQIHQVSMKAAVITTTVKTSGLVMQ